MIDHTNTVGTAGNDFLHTMRGGVFAHGGDDTIHAVAQIGTNQIHSFAAAGDDLTILDFAVIDRFSHGHHARGGSGRDTFEFVNLANIRSTIVGRIEDFDSSSDRIIIEGVELDFNNLPSNVRVVSYSGGLDDPNIPTQQWLLIDTGTGHLFYALEGARQNMGDPVEQEPHFLLTLPDFEFLDDVIYVDPVNYIPWGYSPDGGIRVEDTDVVLADVLELIEGSDLGDLISAGLNDDTVNAGSGNDVVWGGSGNDSIMGGSGRDTIYGGPGYDTIDGGNEGDYIDGGSGNDLISGGWGWDRLDGGDGNDVLDGGSGDDRLYGEQGDDNLSGGSGNDSLDGGAGSDILFGGLGDDIFVFRDFDYGYDMIGDFSVGRDSIRFMNGVDSFDQLHLSQINVAGMNSLLIRFLSESGTIDHSMGGVTVFNVSLDQVDQSVFSFL